MTNGRQNSNGAVQPRTLRPFRYTTRQRMQQVATVPIALGNQVSTELPRVGLISGIILNFSSVLTLSAAGVFTAGAPWNILKRIAVNLNTGAASIFNCSGFGAFIVNSRMLRSSMYLNAAMDNASSLIGANNVFFSLYIPIAMNDQLQFENGLINLQAPEVRMTIDLTFAASGAEFVTNFTSITGNVNLSYVYYELPDPRSTQYPPLALHRILEERTAITAVGDQVYTFPRGGSLMQLCQVVTLNGAHVTLEQGLANSNLIDSVRMVLNKTDTVYNNSGRGWALWQALQQGGVNPVGKAIDWNFFDAGATRAGEGDSRDWINSEALSTLEFFTTINSGAVIGASAFLDNIRRIYQQLAA